MVPPPVAEFCGPEAPLRTYRCMRGRLMVLLGAIFLDSQCGGFRGKGTNLASLGVRGFLAATRACRISSMALFVDLKSGFYTVVRELVVRLQASGDDLERVLESISAPVQLGSALLRLMAEPSIVERHLGEGLRGTSAPCCLRHTQTHGSSWRGSLRLPGLLRAPGRDAAWRTLSSTWHSRPCLSMSGAPWAMPVSSGSHLPPRPFLPFAMLTTMCGVRPMPTQ